MSSLLSADRANANGRVRVDGDGNGCGYANASAHAPCLGTLMLRYVCGVDRRRHACVSRAAGDPVRTAGLPAQAPRATDDGVVLAAEKGGGCAQWVGLFCRATGLFARVSLNRKAGVVSLVEQATGELCCLKRHGCQSPHFVVQMTCSRPS